MIKAFVFGKFLPFHKGHEAMINFALTKCDFLTVLICCSDKENIPDFVRKTWIDKTFINEKKIEVRTFNYVESELPNSSKSSEKISEIWAYVFKKELPDYSILVTSEPYGEFVAKYMNIKHIPFDPLKKIFPISASFVRNDFFGYWKYLPNSVKTDLALKVVILGTESTGKTTLTEKLSTFFKCSIVSEAGRELIPDSNSFSINDLHLVAQEHAKRIESVVLGESPLVIIDTDIHITKSYSKYTFGEKLEVSEDIYNTNKANLYLYLNNDVEYVQDGTRLCEIERNLLDISHRQVLTEHQIKIVEIKGDWNERFENAVEQINKLVTDNKRKHWT